MQLYFAVPDTATTHEGVLVRSFLRQCAVSTDLARAVKFRGGGFFADGEPVLANRRIFPGQVLSFALPPEGDGVTPQPEIPVRVVYEDAFAVVLEKPPQLAVHPTLNYPGGTLANGYAAWAAAHGHSPVFRPVNRIDKDTSGLVLAAKNAYAAPLLASGVAKLYYAIAQGALPLGEGGVDAPIGRRGDSIIGRCVTPRGQAQPHRVHYYKGRKRPQPCGLRAGDRPHPPDPGAFCVHRPSACRGRPLRRQPGAHWPAGAALCPAELCRAGIHPAVGRHPGGNAPAAAHRDGGKPTAAGHGSAFFVKTA